MPTEDDSNNKYNYREDQNIDEIHERLTEDEMRMMTRSAIRKQIEIEIYIPCAARISKCCGIRVYKINIAFVTVCTICTCFYLRSLILNDLKFTDTCTFIIEAF